MAGQHLLEPPPGQPHGRLRSAAPALDLVLPLLLAQPRRLHGEVLGGGAQIRDQLRRAASRPLLDLGVALAITAGAQAVAYGAHAGDHFIYPDCRPGFVTAYQQMALAANDGFLPAGFTVAAPFITMTKAGIAALAARLSVPIGQTWSCYRGGQLHCGTCGTCTERREALALAGVPDPTEYAAG